MMHFDHRRMGPKPLFPSDFELTQEEIHKMLNADIRPPFLLPQDQLYKDLVEDILKNGERSSNRTGIDTLFKIGNYWELDASPDSFPVLTTKRVYWKQAFAEMLGFIRGYSSAADFRRLGCRVWDANANENQEWLNNRYRLGTDDLGRIYGVQWRRWRSSWSSLTGSEDDHPVDQLKEVIVDLSYGIDNRREIVTAWQPAELHKMALPPCHMTMIFSLVEEASKVDLFLLIRSSDTGLGLPFNVAQYAFLLNLVAAMTNKVPGTLRVYSNNVHIYVNHIEPLKKQIERESSLHESGAHPVLNLNHDVCYSLDSLCREDLTLDDIASIDFYSPQPPIKMDMAV